MLKTWNDQGLYPIQLTTIYEQIVQVGNSLPAPSSSSMGFPSSTGPSSNLSGGPAAKRQRTDQQPPHHPYGYGSMVPPSSLPNPMYPSYPSGHQQSGHHPMMMLPPSGHHHHHHPSSSYSSHPMGYPSQGGPLYDAYGNMIPPPQPPPSSYPPQYPPPYSTHPPPQSQQQHSYPSHYSSSVSPQSHIPTHPPQPTIIGYDMYNQPIYSGPAPISTNPYPPKPTVASNPSPPTTTSLLSSLLPQISSSLPSNPSLIPTDSSAVPSLTVGTIGTSGSSLDAILKRLQHTKTAFSSDISSSSTSSPVPTVITTASIQEKDEMAAIRLYGGIGHRCTICALRFYYPQELEIHLAEHAREETASKVKGMSSRDWHMTEERWLRCHPREEGSAESPFDSANRQHEENVDQQGKNTISSSTGGDNNSNNTGTTVVPIDAVREDTTTTSTNTTAVRGLCTFCGDSLNKKFDDETDAWVYTGAILDPQGKLYHQACYSKE